MTREVQSETRETPSGWLRRAWPWLSVLLPVALFLWIGERGLDFGRHWDEPLRWQSVRTAIEEETLLPDTFYYPSMSFWVSVAALGPEAVEGVEIGKKKRPGYLQELARFTETDEYHLRLRRCFLWLSAMSLVWVWALVVRWRRRYVEGMIAASLLGFAWEVGYHARWAAPDVLMVMFTAFCVMALLRALDEPGRRRWLWTAAVAAGLATGTKYNAGLLLLPVLGVAWAIREGEGWRRVSGRMLALVGVFAATFLATTPGAVLRPLIFVQNVRFEMRHYGVLGTYGFTVDKGWDHFSRNVEYLLTVLPSPFVVVSVLMTGLGLLGVGVLVRESRSKALLLIGLPLLYLLYLSTQRVMFVRNLLFIAPFGAVLVTRGVGFLGDNVTGRVGRRVLAGVVGALLLANVTWAVYAAETIRDRESDRFVRALGEYLESESKSRFFVSPQVVERMKVAGVVLPSGVRTEPGEAADYFVSMPDELCRLEIWPGLMKGRMVKAFGPREVNIEYYATWMEQRPTVLAWEVAREIADLQERPWLQAVFVGLGGEGQE